MDIRAGVAMFDGAEGVRRLAGFPFALLTWVSDDGYPISAAIRPHIDSASGHVRFAEPAGLSVPVGPEVSLTGSHIRPQPGIGYDERRHVTVWGKARREPDGRLSFSATAAWGWDEATIPFPEYVE
ncbi:MAG TPA: hypothetical protein VJK49_04050, partial [Candidatus Limnocylindrales bacterium]|nr:hypothetical protein [Candidatus Limnocylindrales bacterium]